MLYFKDFLRTSHILTDISIEEEANTPSDVGLNFIKLTLFLCPFKVSRHSF